MFSQPDEMELLNDIIFGGSLKPVSAFQSFRWFFCLFYVSAVLFVFICVLYCIYYRSCCTYTFVS